MWWSHLSVHVWAISAPKTSTVWHCGRLKCSDSCTFRQYWFKTRSTMRKPWSGFSTVHKPCTVSLKLDTAQQCCWYKTSVLSSTFYTLLKGHKLNCINCRGRGRGSCTVNSFCAPYYCAQPCSLVKYLSNFVLQLMYRTANTVLHPVRLPAADAIDRSQTDGLAAWPSPGRHLPSDRQLCDTYSTCPRALWH